MKLLKKLLPLASVASAAAIIAPVVTSCATNYDIDVKDYDYSKHVTKHDPITYTQAEVTKKYFDEAVKDDYKILRNDLVFAIPSKYGDLDITEAKAYVSNVKVEVKDNIYFLSYKTGLKYTGVDKTDTTNEVTETYEDEVLCNNLPCEITEYSSYVVISPLQDLYLLQNTNWQIKYSTKETKKSNTVSDVKTESGYANQNALNDSLAFEMATVKSWYFEDVTISQ